MSAGWLRVVGNGPAGPDWVTPETTATLAQATDLVGYGPYLTRVDNPGARHHASDNREELARAQHALDMARDGGRVVVVSGGDPGVFAMAAAVMEALDADDEGRWATVDVTVEPGVSAMQAAAARLGAPLGNDFCVMSLSDNLKPWALVERRLRLAAEGDFAIALYNPISRARPWQLGAALDVLRTVHAPATPVILAKAVGRGGDESVRITTLADADPRDADMRTLVLVGASTTRAFRHGGVTRVYTPRSYPEVAGS
ncbi:precorrin-3B C(17)-methyltransferase [Aquisalimonas sp. 2447]|uniref:precorrin-3B C(17)-methyltransferase n=1 Tax=Aquisalimonas sp. 2447 TaxID=2740807 RepID=UPI00143249E3|nr:precorrin-3B C(17)-methyltransferase [Aquisalimonas sp. 2447]QIT56998.1 precorrin-3B C(17)-methyltransferase [Aquisalimonas sp. 2447]